MSLGQVFTLAEYPEWHCYNASDKGAKCPSEAMLIPIIIHTLIGKKVREYERLISSIKYPINQITKSQFFERAILSEMCHFNYITH